MSKHSAEDRWHEQLPALSFKPFTHSDLHRRLAATHFTLPTALSTNRTWLANTLNPSRPPYWRRVWNALRGQ